MTPDGYLVADAVVHGWNMTETNCANHIAEDMTRELHGLSNRLTPPEYRVPDDVWHRDRSAAELERVVFGESDTDFAIYHNTPLFDFFEDGASALETGVELRENNPGRVALYGGVDPLRDGWEDHMDHLVDDLGVDGIKLYPSEFSDGETLDVRLDREDRALPVVRRADELDVDVVAVHKAVPIGPSSQRNLDTEDVEAVAPRFPDLQFEVIHAGFAFLEDAALALRHPNVWANLEITANYLTAKPRLFAEVLGELLFWGGPDRILFATGTTFTHPQPLIEAFLDFEMPADLQAEFGYPAVTDEMKRRILGLNALELHGIDPRSIEPNAREGPDHPEPWSTIA